MLVPARGGRLDGPAARAPRAGLVRRLPPGDGAAPRRLAGRPCTWTRHSPSGPRVGCCECSHPGGGTAAGIAGRGALSPVWAWGCLERASL
eukprot:15444435-Alexandrium_andersonii.AAC.1